MAPAPSTVAPPNPRVVAGRILAPMGPSRPRPSLLGRIRAALGSSEPVLVAAGGVAVGLLAGGGVLAFKAWIHAVEAAGAWARAAVPGLGPAVAALVPAVGGLLVGGILVRWIGEERHHGVAGVMESIALAGGRLRYRRLPAKMVAAGLSIGSGASVGPEDPSVQIGANVGSFVGQRLRLSDDRVRALVAAGAAAGIAAAFDAPIAGVFFALELLLGDLAAGALGTVLLAAVCAAALTHGVVGEHPAFVVPPYALHSALELPAYVLLGVLAGLVAGLYVTALYASHDLFHRLHAPRWVKPALAGAVVGVVGLGWPWVLGVGYEGVGAVLSGEPVLVGTLVGLCLAKLALTALCIGAGFPGGVFAPSLFLGAMLGGALGRLAEAAGLAPAAAPGAFALVGMGAVLAGAVHAPLTAILLLFELTRDYRIMVPAMLAVATSLVVSRRVRRDSVYTLGLARKGLRLERGRDVDVLEGLTVADVMQTTAPTVPASAPARDALDAVARTRHLGLAVLDATGDLVGIVAAMDLDRAVREGRIDAATVGDVCTRDVVVAHPGETLAAALRRLSARDVGRLPVVDPAAPRRLVGMLRRSDVVRAYEAALARRTELRHRAQQVRLGAATDATVSEVGVEAGAPCDGKRVADVAWPRACVLATLRRGGRGMLPRGDTVLRAGDVLVAVTEGDALAAVRGLCAAGPGVPDAATRDAGGRRDA